MKRVKKGDRFICTEDVVMNPDKEIAYYKGKEYVSEQDNCITDEEGITCHFWLEDDNGYFEWPNYFKRL